MPDCHLPTGAADCHLRVVVAGLEACESFIRNRIHPIGGKASIESSFVYGAVKTTGVFPQVG